MSRCGCRSRSATPIRWCSSPAEEAKDEEIVLEANEQYWRGAPKIKTVKTVSPTVGPVRLRGEYKVESTQRGKQQVVVTSIPYTVNKATLVEEIANEIIAGQPVKHPYVGVELSPTTSAEFGRFIASETVKWADVIKRSGTKLD